MRFLALLLVCPLLSGCLFLACPTLDCTREVLVKHDDVSAFRVNITHSGGALMWCGRSQHDTFEVHEVPIAASKLDAQQDVRVSYFFLLFPLLSANFSQSFEVLLYRPGYETVTVSAWPWWFPLGYCGTESVHWEKLNDLRSQEKALQAVIWKSGKSITDHNPELLRFAAREYARLAQSPLAAAPEMHADRDNLLANTSMYERLVREQDKRGAPNAEER